MLIDITKKREKKPDFIEWCKNLGNRAIQEVDGDFPDSWSAQSQSK